MAVITWNFLFINYFLRRNFLWITGIKFQHNYFSLKMKKDRRHYTVCPSWGIVCSNRHTDTLNGTFGLDEVTFFLLLGDSDFLNFSDKGVWFIEQKFELVSEFFDVVVEFFKRIYDRSTWFSASIFFFALGFGIVRIGMAIYWPAPPLARTGSAQSELAYIMV